MTNYPFAIDDDSTILRIDDNLSELGVDVINQIRDAIFAIESELGITPSGSLGSVADRFDVSFNPNGTIKSSALTSIGLVALPIDNSQVGASAGILESKLTLDFSTSDLNALIQTNLGTINTLISFTSVTNSDLLAHIAGTDLADASTSRHVATHIDLNDVPSDPRDPFFIWDGLKDKTGTLRAATTVGEALLEINDDYVQHQLNETGDAHFASGISVDVSNFNTIPKSSDTVQEALQSIDDANTVIIQTHQQTHHSNGVPKESRSNIIDNTDGYSSIIIPPTQCTALLVNIPSTTPVDNNTTGDDIISFNPNSSGFVFDEKFARVTVGDTIRINYGNGIEGIFLVESKRHIPGSEWIIRINGNNLANADGYSAYATISKKRFEVNNWGTLAVAAANNNIDPAIPSSVIVGNPKGAQVLGLNFDASCLDSTHYNLYLIVYPTGNPSDGVIDLPAIDVTGNAGATPGSYTLDSIVHNVNNTFRTAGYNYRFIAFKRNGEFGIMLADSIDNAAFSIANGIISGGILNPGAYVNNVIGDAVDEKDALGFGTNKGSIASPKWTPSWSSAVEAQSLPTKIFYPLANKQYVTNGISSDRFANTYLATNGHWDGYISNRVPVGITTVETTYQIAGNLAPAGLKSGKTIVVQPTVARNDPLYSNVDYGRFIIKEVNFSDCACEDNVGDYTSITVINSLHATGVPVGNSAVPELPVRVYFSEDSVSFNQSNVFDSINANDYIRYHEIYITEGGNTFSHERARMPEQFETTELLSTALFKINEVSPKLKGYSDIGANDRYIRFYVLNFDSTTGEFDGYLGQIVTGSPDIINFGQVVKARKNVPTRFYDSSNIDYIELEYTEINQSPGAGVISTASPRYVDIQIFDTLATDQEVLRLAGVNIIDNEVYVTSDLREFGTVSETDFTDSAIKFIESGVRNLHSNGIISGLNYVGSDSDMLNFNGGMALINGHVTPINAQGVCVPEIVQMPGPVTTIDWAVCVNETGSLIMLPLTASKTQFFAKKISAGTNYYIQSASFSEIIDNRKDLVILYIVNVTIASVTINSVQDSRRFVTNQDLNTWTFSTDGYHDTTFRSTESVLNWANRYGLNEVRLVPSTISTALDFRSLTSDLKIIGDKNKNVEVTSDIGVHSNSFLELENIKFVYNSTFAGFDSGDIAHLVHDKACVYFDGSNSDINNVKVKNCHFTRTVNSERCPFILAKLVDDGYVDTMDIEHNTFVPGSADNLNSSIAIVSVGTTLTSYMTNVNIDKNKIGGKNSILCVPVSTNIGLVARGVNITSNHIPNGCIGVKCIGTTEYLTFENNLNIDNNKAVLIFNSNSNGKFDGTSATSKGMGIVNISKNTSQYIQYTGDNTASIFRSKISIVTNTLLNREISSFFTEWNYGSGANAIEISGTTTLVNSAYIADNSIYGNNSLMYNDGISVISCRATITNNTVHAFARYGIRSIFADNAIISENRIFRNGNTISRYIYTGGVVSIYSNTFDSTTIDSSNEQTITYASDSYVERNINHIKSIELPWFNIMKQAGGSPLQYTIEHDDGGTDTDISYIRVYLAGKRSQVEFLTTGSATLRGDFNLPLFLPHEAKIVSASLAVQANNTNWTSGTIEMFVISVSLGTLATATPLDITANSSGTLTATLASPERVFDSTLVVRETSIEPVSSTNNIQLQSLIVKYTW